MADIKLFPIKDKDVAIHYDFMIDQKTGDIVMTDGLDTSLIMSVFCEKRDNSIQIPENRGGWMGNEMNDNSGYEIGNLNWIKYQSKLDDELSDEISDNTEDGLNWLVEDKIVEAFEVRIDVNLESNSINSNLLLQRNNNIENVTFFNVWKQT